MVAQFILMIALVVVPPRVNGWPAPLPSHPLLDALAVVLIVAGIVLLFVGGRHLGRNLTPLPTPKSSNALVHHGVYRLVRHPIYGGLMLMAVGWGLRRGGGLTIVCAVLLVWVLAAKSRREEIWLTLRHPEYAAYRRHTKRFLPLIW